MDKKSIKSFKYDDLEKEVIENLNEKKYRAKQIYEWLYRKKAEKFEEMTNLSKELIAKLNENYYIDNLEILKKTSICRWYKKIFNKTSDSVEQ